MRVQQTNFPFNMNIGNTIKTLRSARGLTQKELALASSLSVGYLCQIEKNQKEPPISTLTDISKAIGIPLSLIVFMASSAEDLTGIGQDAQEKLSASILSLLKGVRNAQR